MQKYCDTYYLNWVNFLLVWRVEELASLTEFFFDWFDDLKPQEKPCARSTNHHQHDKR